MLKKIFFYSSMIVLLASCSSLKTAFTGSRQSAPEIPATAVKKETKFLDQNMEVETPKSKKQDQSTTKISKNEVVAPTDDRAFKNSADVELSSIQVKYAVILNTTAEEVRNTKMFEFIDDWYGTPYRLGGTTKKGVDCSAFSQFLFASVYGFSIPRTAREQYKFTDRISRTQLKEGDLLFFNTRGGISHVGIYLQNNKFVHASTSGGVMISDVFEEYWARKFVGVGRLKEKESIVISR
jgi:lipoprotein Spr